MQTITPPEEKLKIDSCDNSTYELKEKTNGSKLSLDFKSYQTVLLILLTSCTFLIFPELPQDSEVLCEKYYSLEKCIVF